MSAGVSLLRVVAGHRLVTRVATVAATVFLIWVWQFVVVAGSHVDADAYRLVDGDHPYGMASAGQEHAYLYSPVVAQLLALVRGIPPAIFYALLAGLSLAALVYLLGGRWAAASLVLPLPFIWQDLMTGNIHLILAACVVIGFRVPSMWAVVLLTKVTPGIGLVWFAMRREWRAVALAVGSTVGVTLLSFLLAPALWFEWTRVLTTNAGGPAAGLSVPIPLLIRMPASAILVGWGARSNRAWTVPVACFLSLPVIWIWDGFAILTGAAALLLRPDLAKPIPRGAPRTSRTAG